MRFAASLVLLIAAAYAAAADRVDSVYRKTLQGTAQVRTASGTGTGWIVDGKKKWLVTAEHVVGSDRVVRIVFPAYRAGRVVGERDHYDDALAVTGRVVRVDADRDLALIELESVPVGVVALPLAAESPEPGETVHAVGCPGGTAAMWVYSNGPVRQTVGMRLEEGSPGSKPRVIEAQVPLNPGDSGGPLVNQAGEVVGVNHALRRNVQLMTLSIEVAEVRRFLADEAPAAADAPNLDDARQTLAAGKTDEAEAACRKIVRADRRNAAAWTFLAALLNRSGRHADAADAAGFAVRIDERSAAAWAELGAALRGLKKWETAAAALARAIDRDPKQAAPYDHLAEVLDELDEPAAARAVRRRKAEIAD